MHPVTFRKQACSARTPMITAVFVCKIRRWSDLRYTGLGRLVPRQFRASNDMKTHKPVTFDVQLFLIRLACRESWEFRRRQTIYTQGDPSKNVPAHQQGTVKLCVVTRPAKGRSWRCSDRAIFFGEDAWQASRSEWDAIAITPITALVIDKNEMIPSFTQNTHSPTVSSLYCFPEHPNRGDLVDRYSLHEKRLARTLLLLARMERTTASKGSSQDIARNAGREQSEPRVPASISS